MAKQVPEYAWDGGNIEQEPSERLDFREYLRVLFKFKWGIISVALLTGLIGMYMAYKSVPIYRSTVILQIEREQNNPLQSGFFFPDFQAKFYETQRELIRSWGVAEMAAERLDLLDADHLEGKVKAPGKPAFSWRTLVPDFLKTKPPEITPEARRSSIINSIKGGTQVGVVAESQLVTVSFEGANAEMASRKANTVAQSYIDFLREKNLSDLTGEQSWFSSRMVQARDELEKAQVALQAFLDRQGMVQTSEGVDALQNQSFQEALTRRENARQQKLALQRLNSEIEAAQASGTPLDSITALNSRGIVTDLKSTLASARQRVLQLSKRYGPKHPQMIEAQSALESASTSYKAELQNAADIVLVDYQRAVRTEAEYTRYLDEAEADIQALNRSRAELTHLQDQVNTSRALFEQLQEGEQRGELLQGGLQKINATIIENARPGLYPVRPDKKMITLAWAIGGLVLGIGLAFLLNILDNTFRGSEDVERRLGLPVLGQLPQLKFDKQKKLGPMSFFIDQPRSAFSESIRTIRTSVLLSLLDKEKSIITVTSSVPGEGKTTVAINLAHSIQQMKKTLLIDADMRRPMVHRAKKIEQPRPGLAALMTGEATFEEAHEETEDGLHVIPSGTVPANPLELLSSQRFKELIKELQETYEVIIIDSAPALAVSDALVVSQLADAHLYVIRADATPYQAAQQGIKRLRRVNSPLLGCILNQVVSGAGGYGYGKYGKYGRYYRYYRYGRYGYGRYGYYSADDYYDYYASDDDKKA
jgi:capsular exopolysaccharide synthesis family protein